MKQVEKSGVKPKELDEIFECPLYCKYIWDWFMRLNQRRVINIITGATTKVIHNPLQYSEIYYFNKINYNQIRDEEIQILEVMDIKYITFLNIK